MNRGREIRELTRMRLLLFWREPEAMFWVFLFPVVLALVLSLAFKSRGVETVQVGYVTGALAERWITALEDDATIDLVPYADPELAGRKLRAGAVAAMASGDEPVQLQFDPTRPEGETARLRVDDALQRAAGRVDPILVTTDEVTEHGSRYIDFLIPGLLGMNLMGTGIWGTGFAIVDLRQKKLLKRFLVTPMRKSSFLVAQMNSRFFFLVMEVGLITVFGVLVLGVPFRGSLVLFSVLCALGAMCFSGLGLLVGSRAQTTEGVSGIMNFVMMPMWLLSGIFFSYEKYPDVLLPLIRALPLTALIDGVRAVMLEGEGTVALLPQIAVMAVWTVGTFFVALRVFRWR